MNNISCENTIKRPIPAAGVMYILYGLFMLLFACTFLLLYMSLYPPIDILLYCAISTAALSILLLTLGITLVTQRRPTKLSTAILFLIVAYYVISAFLTPAQMITSNTIGIRLVMNISINLVYIAVFLLIGLMFMSCQNGTPSRLRSKLGYRLPPFLSLLQIVFSIVLIAEAYTQMLPTIEVPPVFLLAGLILSGIFCVIFLGAFVVLPVFLLTRWLKSFD